MIYSWPLFYFHWTDAVVDLLPEKVADSPRDRELVHQNPLELLDAHGVRGLVKQRKDVGPYPKVEAEFANPLVKPRVVVVAVSLIRLLAQKEQHDQGAALEVLDVHSAPDSVNEKFEVHGVEAMIHFFLFNVCLFLNFGELHQSFVP